MDHKALIFLHLLGFAAYVGAGFAQHRFMSRSSRSGIDAKVRDEYEKLAAVIVTRIELPALMLQVLTGVAFLVLNVAWLQQAWLHAKLTCVAVLLVLSHLEMFNARKIVAQRGAQGEASGAEIAKRKSRHAVFGGIGAAFVAALVALVAYGTG